METVESTENREIILKIRIAQVQQLYKQTWGGLIGVLITAFSACFILWPVITHKKLLVWVGILILVCILRGFLSVAFQRNSSKDSAIYFWARLHVAGACATGLLWAAAPIFLWPDGSPVHQIVWPICIVTMAASVVAKYYTWTAAYLPYLFLTLVPLSLRLLTENGLTYSVLGVLGLLFIIVLAQTGIVMHETSFQAFETGIRNEALSLHLSQEKEKEVELTRKLQIAHDQLRQLSMTDELTGLWNRRFLNATISEDVEQVIRNYHSIHQGREISLLSNIDLVFVLIDLDHFKEVNDTYGHGAGDQVLVQMRQLLTGASRDTDTVIRWGGEEFMVVARNSCREHYMFLVERIRKAIELHNFDIGAEQTIQITCSIGAAVFPFFSNSPEALTWDKVVELADACLYAAKRSGRNSWVGVVPTNLAIVEDFSPNVTKNLSDLILEGKLEMKTSMSNNASVCWTD